MIDHVGFRDFTRRILSGAVQVGKDCGVIG